MDISCSATQMAIPGTISDPRALQPVTYLEATDSGKASPCSSTSSPSVGSMLRALNFSKASLKTLLMRNLCSAPANSMSSYSVSK